jgi:hypothetical protein
MGQIIDPIIMSELAEEGEARLRFMINEYICESTHRVAIMKILLYVFHQLPFFMIKDVLEVQQDFHVFQFHLIRSRYGYEQVAVEAIWLSRLVSGQNMYVGVNIY